MDEKCVCHVNGYRVKDTEARRTAESANRAAEEAKATASRIEKNNDSMNAAIRKANSTANEAGARAEAAFNAAVAAENTAATAAKDVNDRLNRRGGTMFGDLDMNGNNIKNVRQIESNRVISNLHDFSHKYNAKRRLFRATPSGDGNALEFQSFEWDGERFDESKPSDVVVSGVAAPAKSTDAANKGYVDAKVKEARFPDWSGLKWYVLGDSLTDPAGGVHTSKFYYEYIAEKTGIQVIVDGLGGTGYYAGVSTGTNFAERVKNIPDDVDIVTIFGSVNDVVHGYDNYASHISAAMGHIWNNRPGLPVIIVPPSPCKEYQKRGDDWKNYCDRIELCALNYDMRYVDDMFKCPPFNPASDAQLQAFFNKDAEGIHPDENGHREIARYIYDAMLKELAFK